MADCVLSNSDDGAATAQWSSIQTTLAEHQSDVLILMDCCSAGSSVAGSCKGTTEVIAACGFEAFAPGVGKDSFTSSLIEELKWFGLRRRLISSVYLHNRVTTRIMNTWNPRYATDGSAERRKTPIFFCLDDRSNHRCINLSPLENPLAYLVPPPIQASSTSQSSTTLSTNPDDIDMLDVHGSSQTSLDEVFPDPDFLSPKVSSFRSSYTPLSLDS